MTQSEIKKLDALFQQRCIELNPLCVISYQPATVVHHYRTRTHMATRWYIPNGIPLSHRAHLYAHDKVEEFKDQIIHIKGKEWHQDIIRQSNRIAKYIKYSDVIDHLTGEIPHYI